MAIEGVAYATIISQFISAALVLVVLSRSTENYRLTWRDLRIDKGIFKQILRIGLPTGFQQSLTSFSNVYVQSYINTFGSSCMAGWSSYSKIDQFVFLPMQSIGQASTTFMSQNLGAGNLPRAKKGTGVAMRLALIITFASAAILFLFAPSLVAIFNQEPDVVRYGTMFLRMNVFMLAFCCPNQVVAGAMRGAGDSRTPMLIMLFSFVLFRQIYLYIATSICNTAAVVGFGYPIGWRHPFSSSFIICPESGKRRSVCKEIPAVTWPSDFLISLSMIQHKIQDICKRLHRRLRLRVCVCLRAHLDQGGARPDMLIIAEAF